MYKVDRYKLASMLLTFFSMTVVVTAIFLLAGISVSIWNILFASTVTASIFLYKDNDFKKTIFHLVVVAAIIVLITLFSGSVFDQTWDGAAYHKQAIGFLKYGWNPVYQANTVFNELSHNIQIPRHNPMLWAEAYPKATWYFSASIYALTGNIESGKMYHLLFALITYLFFSEFLIRKGLKKYQAILSSLVIALNPVVLAQFCSYYLDSVVVCSLMLIMLLFMQVFEGRDQAKNWLNLSFLMIIGCNLKFSVGLFVATYAIIFILYYCYRETNKRKVGGRFLILAFSAFMAVGVVGVSPYLTNLLRYQNIFYGFIGEQGFMTKDLAGQYFGIKGLSDPVMFFLSLIGRMSHGNLTQIGDLVKIPFTFKMEELNYYYYVDPRVGGLGVFFSGIFFLSIIVWALKRKQWRKEFSDTKDKMLIVEIFSWISFIEMAFLPTSYNTRYIGHIYILFFISLFILFSLENKLKNKISNYIGIFICVMGILNTAPYVPVMLHKIDAATDIRATLNYMKNRSQEGKKYQVCFYVDDFSGMNYNLMDKDINYELVLREQVDETFQLTYANWLYYKELP